MKLRCLNENQIQFLALEMGVKQEKITQLFLKEKDTLIDKSMEILNYESNLSDQDYKLYNADRADAAEEILNLLLDYVMVS